MYTLINSIEFLFNPLLWICLGFSTLTLGIYLSLKAHINNLSLRIIELEDDIDAIGSGAMGVGRKLTAVESELKVVESQQEEMAYRDSHQPKPYMQAAKMAEMGATIKELMETCQLTQGEAELLVHLNQHHAA